MKNTMNLNESVQITDGFTQTCADGATLAFDSKYGIMFCAYMPGYHGDYGESRGKIALSYFPASQPTNIKFVDIASGHTEYVPNLISLGEGRVRVFYEKDSREKGDHPVCYKDFDYITNSLSEEKIVMVKQEDGSLVGLTQSVQFAYLEKNGYHNHVFHADEQIIVGGGAFFKGDDGLFYGAIASYLSEVVLMRSTDNMATVEFFAIYPKQVQYEFDYRFLEGKIYAIYRKNFGKNAILYTTSEDFGKTWSEPIAFEESIECRPRIVVHNGHILMAYNYYCDDTDNRPKVTWMGRTAIRLCYIDRKNADGIVQTAEIKSKYGIVNISLIDVLGDLYMAYSTSILALEYLNGTSYVRGKDAVRYVNLGNLII